MKNKPVHHRKRFALLFSLTITLAILGVWSLVNFGTGGVLATKEDNAKQVKVTANEVSPLESMYRNLASSFSAMGSGLGDIKSSLKSFNPYNNSKNEMGENVLNTYDR